MSAISEDEAKTKWCPFVRWTNESSDYQSMNNRGQPAECVPHERSLCIGSACVAWRWAREKETAAFLADVQSYMQDNTADFAKATQAVWKEKAGTYENTEGFCGLVGKP